MESFQDQLEYIFYYESFSLKSDLQLGVFFPKERGTFKKEK